MSIQMKKSVSVVREASEVNSISDESIVKSRYISFVDSKSHGEDGYDWRYYTVRAGNTMLPPVMRAGNILLSAGAIAVFLGAIVYGPCVVKVGSVGALVIVGLIITVEADRMF